jgi:hypothetical protein
VCRYLAGSGQRSIMTGNTSGMSCARSYRNLRDDALEGRFSRHFVPGYDRVVPPGQYGSSAWNRVEYQRFPCLKSSRAERLPEGLHWSRSRYSAWHETPTSPMRPSTLLPLRSSIVLVLVVVLVIELWPLLGKGALLLNRLERKSTDSFCCDPGNRERARARLADRRGKKNATRRPVPTPKQRVSRRQ